MMVIAAEDVRVSSAALSKPWRRGKTLGNGVHGHRGCQGYDEFTRRKVK